MPIYLGASWYPEHWPAARWPRDIELMREANFTVTRVGEFAWSRMEPREGKIELGWLRDAVDLAANAGLDVVIGTPTAAPPAWLTHRYPETLAIAHDNQQAQHGMRCHYDPTSETYIRFSRRIADALAREFGNHPRVIGWQIDNEFNTVSYSAGAARKFRDWLRSLYGTLEALNDAWTTSYWSQEYSDWEQIPLPMRGGYNGERHNPALRLKWRQFATETYRIFQRHQVDAIRAHARPGQWITHNFMGFYDGYDHYKLSEDLDIASWDQYVHLSHLDFGRDCVMHDLVRGFKRKNFWLIETQPGNVNWAPLNLVLDRGETRALAYNAIGHGADAVVYWQWRNALNGQEQYHGSLLAQDGEPRPVFAEIAQLGRELQKIGPVLDGAAPRAEAALLHSYDDRWLIDNQRHNNAFDATEYFKHLHTPFALQNVGADVLSTRAKLDGYKLIVAAPHSIDAAIAAELTRFVQNGGHLVLCLRSGMKNSDNKMFEERQPALLQGLAGAHVDEYYALREPVTLDNGATGHAWAEWLTPHEGTRVLARFNAYNGWLDGQAAITVHEHAGGGRVYCVGAWLDDAGWQAFMADVFKQAGVAPVLPNLPAGVHAVRRGDCIVVIANRAPVEFALPNRMTDLISGSTLDRVRLPAWGVVVLK